jgi:hypothetical protein
LSCFYLSVQNMENWFQNWFLSLRFMAFERQAAQNKPSRFPNSFFWGKFSFELISDSHDWLFAAPYLWFYVPNKDKIPPFDSA